MLFCSLTTFVLNPTTDVTSFSLLTQPFSVTSQSVSDNN